MTASTTHILVFVSLGSRTFSIGFWQLLRQAINIHFANPTIHACMLDAQEHHNLTRIFGLSAEQAQMRIHERILRIRADLRQVFRDRVRVERSSDLDGNSAYIEYRAAAERLLCRDPHLRHRYENDCFQNLMPILRRFMVKNRRSPLVREVAGYLVDEDAIRLTYSVAYPEITEYGAHEANDLCQAIRDEIAAFSPAVRVPKYVQLRFQQPGHHLSVSRLSFSYDNRANGRFLVSEVTLEARSGEIVGLFGPSGSGKSTLLSLVAGGLRSHSGAIEIDGQSVGGLPPGQRGVVTVFQDHGLFPHLTVEGNVQYGLARHPAMRAAEEREITQLFLDRLSLTDVREKSISSISGGERQRTAIARALIVEPKVLLLDEPTASLDHIQRETLAKWLQMALAGPSMPVVLIVSHDRDFLLSLCSRIYILRHGQLLEAGTVAQLTTAPTKVDTAVLLSTHGILDIIATAGHVVLQDMALRVGVLPSGLVDGPYSLLVPPHAIQQCDEQAAGALLCRVAYRRVSGDRIRVYLEPCGVQCESPPWIDEPISALDRNRTGLGVGHQTYIAIDPRACIFVPARKGP